ncbi:hypothetical protein GCM10010365_38630 [Streptomyces poonensis]|uniref:Uncharacterized protein n=1 Tax=Streptomyces poonensis TaxID=68255 RepID=A0A918PLG5_9ACTN|nr:hypothetical protein GCM10010365_38630 [Streptomyces poonensis]GLJ91466.1 hypothetical protein GCM10017589_40730 [Streptomyces poonensis]
MRDWTEAMEWVPFSSWVRVDVASIPRGVKRFSLASGVVPAGPRHVVPDRGGSRARL